jgi:hypothetical protein
MGSTASGSEPAGASTRGRGRAGPTSEQARREPSSGDSVAKRWSRRGAGAGAALEPRSSTVSRDTFARMQCGCRSARSVQAGMPC